jgi:hypothetical protein
MKIEIAERLHPFSHLPGIKCLLPLSWWQVEVFPAGLQFQSLVDPNHKMQVSLSVSGPVEEFTAEVDLEKGAIRVFGMTQKGYLRYQIRRQPDGIALEFEKLPSGGIECVDHHSEQRYPMSEKHTVLLKVPREHPSHPLSLERLSLGMHKAQDWELICRRKDLKEIFPIWLRAGQLTPPDQQTIVNAGTLRQLVLCQEAIGKRNAPHIGSLFLLLFRTAFSGISAPRIQDTDFQGILPIEEIDPSLSPLPLLTLGAALIRSLFFEETEGCWKFLPCLPSDFSAGRFVGISTEQGEKITLEWAKHRLRKVVIHTAKERDLKLQFPKPIRSVRLKTARTQKGKIMPVQEGLLDMHLKPNQVIYLDRFER